MRRFITQVTTKIEVLEDDSKLKKIGKHVLQFIINILYAVAVRGNIFSSIITVDYFVQVMQAQQEEPPDLEMVRGVILGGLLTIVVVLIETIKRYANQNTYRQLAEKRANLFELNEQLEAEKSETDRALIFLRDINVLLSLMSDTDYASYDFPQIQDRTFPALQAFQQLPDEMPVKKNKALFYTYKTFTGIVQDFPQAVITSLLFSYLFARELMSVEPFESDNLIFSLVSACLAGLMITWVNIMQRTGLEAEIKDAKTSITNMRTSIAKHGSDLGEGKKAWDELFAKYNQRTDPTTLSFPIATANESILVKRSAAMIERAANQLNRLLREQRQMPHTVVSLEDEELDSDSSEFKTGSVLLRRY